MPLATRILTLLLCFSVASAAEEDLTVVPGKRVGPITALSSLSTLQALFGKANVVNGKIPGPEGSELDGATLFKGTPKELEIVWHEENVGKRISAITIVGKAWKFDSGLKLGMTIEEVEKINGKAYIVGGFDWDYGGYSNFEGGKLAEGLSVRFSPTESNYPSKIMGEVQVPSTDKDLLAAKPVVTSLTLYFPGPY